MSIAGAGAGAALADQAAAALRTIGGLGVYRAPPLQAAAPYAVVEIGPERDWGHKSGAGRELRLAVSLYDRGERHDRLAALAGEAEAALAALPGAAGGWQIVTLALVRGRSVPARASGPARTSGPNALNAHLAEYRARMLAG